MVTADAIEAGYLEVLDPRVVDGLRVISGTVTAAHLARIACLSQLRRLSSFEVDLQPDDLLVLAGLPLVKIELAGVSVPEGAFPWVVGGEWMAPGLRAARVLAGSPVYPVDEQDTDPVDVACLAKAQPDGSVALELRLRLQDGWYAYPPGSSEGVPVSLSVRPDSGYVVTAPLVADSDDGHLTGRAVLTAAAVGTGDDVRMDVTVQVCDGSVCLAPRTYFLASPVTDR
jgi:hypothetical protein